MDTYRAVIVGLTGIGASYYRHSQTEVTGVCDLRQEALNEFRGNWADV